MATFPGIKSPSVIEGQSLVAAEVERGSMLDTALCYWTLGSDAASVTIPGHSPTVTRTGIVFVEKGAVCRLDLASRSVKRVTQPGRYSWATANPAGTLAVAQRVIEPDPVEVVLLDLKTSRESTLAPLNASGGLSTVGWTDDRTVVFSIGGAGARRLSRLDVLAQSPEPRSLGFSSANAAVGRDGSVALQYSPDHFKIGFRTVIEVREASGALVARTEMGGMGGGMAWLSEDSLLVTSYITPDQPEVRLYRLASVR